MPPRCSGDGAAGSRPEPSSGVGDVAFATTRDLVKPKPGFELTPGAAAVVWKRRNGSPGASLRLLLSDVETNTETLIPPLSLLSSSALQRIIRGVEC